MQTPTTCSIVSTSSPSGDGTDGGYTVTYQVTDGNTPPQPIKSGSYNITEQSGGSWYITWNGGAQNKTIQITIPAGSIVTTDGSTPETLQSNGQFFDPLNTDAEAEAQQLVNDLEAAHVTVSPGAQFTVVTTLTGHAYALVNSNTKHSYSLSNTFTISWTQVMTFNSDGNFSSVSGPTLNH